MIGREIYCEPLSRHHGNQVRDLLCSIMRKNNLESRPAVFYMNVENERTADIDMIDLVNERKDDHPFKHVIMVWDSKKTPTIAHAKTEVSHFLMRLRATSCMVKCALQRASDQTYLSIVLCTINPKNKKQIKITKKMLNGCGVV